MSSGIRVGPNPGHSQPPHEALCPRQRWPSRYESHCGADVLV